MKVLSSFVLTAAIACAQVDSKLLLQPLGESWPSYSGDYSGKRYSNLKQVTKTNVKNLTLGWTMRVTPGAAGAIVGGESFGGAMPGCSAIMPSIAARWSARAIPGRPWAPEESAARAATAVEFRGARAACSTPPKPAASARAWPRCAAAVAFVASQAAPTSVSVPEVLATAKGPP